MIKLSQLSFQYPESPDVVLRDINLTINPGTLTLVTGASGSGKSTLLRCINGLVPHFSGGTITGDIQVFGSNPIKEGPEAMALTVGFVFQEPEAQFVYDIVEDEIAFTLENMGLPQEEMHLKVDSIIEELRLSSIRQKKIQHLSGGEMQKVAIASALISHPKVLILDEPTSQLDPVSADEIMKYIVSLRTALGLTVLISGHRLERLLPYLDAIAYLTSEHELLFGSPREILLKMEYGPPLVEIAKKLKHTPLPLTIKDFPEKSLPVILRGNLVKPAETVPGSKELLALSHLSATINDQTILKDVSLQLNSGEILALLGSNGAGKTTLLRAILGLVPSKGIRQLHNKSMDKINLSAIIQHIAYLPQNPSDLLFAESVIEELITTLNNHGMQKTKGELTTFLESFGLAEKQNCYPRDLSVGERQRTALAAITIHEPQIILLDEPTRGLDYQVKRSLAHILFHWRDQGKAILLVTHDIEFSAQVADRVTLLENGKIKFSGSPRIAFTQFPTFRTQTAQLFPGTDWITVHDVTNGGYIELRD